MLRSKVYEDFDRAFEQFLGFPTSEFEVGQRAQTGTVGFELSESDEAFQISLDVPGVNKDEIKIEVDGNQLTVSGERKQEFQDNTKTHKTWSRSYGSFKQTFTLPDFVDSENIKATQSNGVLNVTLPKSEKLQKKTISIS